MGKSDRKLKVQFEKMAEKKRHLMEIIRSLTPDQYAHHITPGTWSVGQIANHLFLSEKLALAYLKKKLSYPDTILPFHIKSWWALYSVNVILRLPIKIKAPKAIDMWQESTVLTPEELGETWDQVRREMVSLMSEHHDRFHSHLVFNHPISGRMTMRQMLIFFNHHMDHHIRQIKKILRKMKTR